MTRKNIRIKVLFAVGAALLSSTQWPSPGAVSAVGFYPDQNVRLPACTSADQEFCVESLWFTPEGGSESAITNPASSSGSDPYVSAGFFQGAYSGPSTSPNALGLMPILNINMTKSGSLETGAIRNGIDPGVYRYRVRLGDYDPTYSVMFAETLTHSVEIGADGYFTLEVSARSKPWMMVSTSQATCLASNWTTNCEADVAYRNWFSNAVVMSGNSTVRERTRGQWISTSASYVVPSPPTVSGQETKQKLTVAGPHFVPVGFGSTGKTENGRDLNPAYYRTFVPYDTALNSLKLINVVLTKEQLQAILATKSIFSGTIVDQRGITQPRKLTITAQEKGVVIDFNLESFSAPNPTLFISNPSRERRTLKSGATISPLQTATKGQRFNRAVLLGPSVGTSIKSVASKTKKVCTTKGSAIKMIKAGKCKLSVTTSVTVNKKKKTAVTPVVVTVT